MARHLKNLIRPLTQIRWNSSAMRVVQKQLFYLTLAVLLGCFGWLAMELPGLVLAFWVVVLWFAVLQRPQRVEMSLIAGLGLIGAAAFLPQNHWFESNRFYVSGFLAVAGTPVVVAIIRRFVGLFSGDQ